MLSEKWSDIAGKVGIILGMIIAVIIGALIIVLCVIGAVKLMIWWWEF